MSYRTEGMTREQVESTATVRPRTSPGFKIRPFTYSDRDYRAVVAIANAIEPDTPSSVAAWKHWDSTREEKYLFRRVVGEVEGNIVASTAYGHTAWTHQPDKYFVYVEVLPDWQQRGLGSRLYHFIGEQLAQRLPKKLVSFTREDHTEAVRFLRNRGFEQVMRIQVSRLDSSRFDTARFADKLRQVWDSGIEIKTLGQLAESDPDWQQQVYDLEWQCLQDVPTTDPFTKRSLESFVTSTLGSPNLLPDAWFVALDGGDYVGLSVLWRNLATDKLLETGLTGVLRSHRRRGIATALKVRAIEYARKHGEATIVTDNEENNPMYQLNLSLGFRPHPAHLDFEKMLGGTSS
jgi:GNAT superfamily N-acetyltransferase